MKYMDTHETEYVVGWWSDAYERLMVVAELDDYYDAVIYAVARATRSTRSYYVVNKSANAIVYTVKPHRR